MTNNFYQINRANIKLKAAMLLLKANQNPKTRVHETAVQPFLDAIESQYEIVSKDDPTVKHKLRLDDNETLRHTLQDMPFVLETSVEKVLQESVEQSDSSTLTSEQMAGMTQKELWAAAALESARK